MEDLKRLTTAHLRKGETMTDYIKREDAKDAVINIVGRETIANYVGKMSKHFSMKDNDYYDALMDAEDAIDDLPPADVAPVKHGMWVDVDRMQMHDIHGVLTWGNSFMCTECNFKTFAVEGHMSQYHYCPNCGAKMDARKDNPSTGE